MSGILVVCDANVCRSAAAEFLFVEQFARHERLAGVGVSSRGAQAIPAHSACRMAVDLRHDASWIARARKHQSAQLDVPAVERADLILTATTSTRAAVVSLAPAARRRVFTLREAVSLATDFIPASGAAGHDLVRDFAAHLDAQRGLRPIPTKRGSRWRRTTHPLDIADGHTIGHRAHAATLREVQHSVAELARTLATEPPRPAPIRRGEA